MPPIENRTELCSHGDGSGREVLVDVVDSALEAVHPDRLVPEHVSREGNTLTIDGRSYDLDAVNDLVVIGAGKGSVDLVAAVREVVGDWIARGVVVEKHGQGRDLDGVDVLEAGHPIPDEASLRAGLAVEGLAREVEADDLVLFCLTGGASALLALPVDTISFDDLVVTNRHLLDAGAPIDEVNAVRKHLSRLKGGHLARAIDPAAVSTLVIVDEVGGDPWGPTVPDPTTFADAVRVLRKHDLWDAIPASVRDYLAAGRRHPDRETPGPENFGAIERSTVVLADATDVCEAAVARAEQLGLNTAILSTMVEGESREIGRGFAGIAKEIAAHRRPVTPPCAIVSGGETTVAVEDSGRAGEGGPNQEFVLGFALGIAGHERITAIAVGTDGTDGPTDLAGGLVDGQTVPTANRAGIDVHGALATHDAGGALRELGDAVVTGGTGTNLMDLRVFLVQD